MSAGELDTAFASLPSWPSEGDLDRDGWERLRAAARAVQRSEDAEVEDALARFLDRDGEGMEGALDETRLFLLSRVVFDLPTSVPVSERRTWKGWINWPEPDADGLVNLSWPVDWNGGDPRLLARYAGSEGHRYDAVADFRDLRSRFAYRDLG